MKRYSLIFRICWLVAALAGARPTLATNLLTNPDFESGATGFSTDLDLWPYTRATDPGMGDMGEKKYVVMGDCNDVHSAWSSFYDHTLGTSSGHYMVCNASSSSSTNLVWSQTVSVTAYTSYQFSFWLANIYASNPASIQLQVNGTDTGTAATNSSGSAAWQQFTVTFNSGASTSVVLDLRELTLAAFGDDYGLDDLYFGATPPPLPVSLVRFAARATDHATVDINWATAMELNSSRFEIQRATSDMKFVTVTEVKAQGNSTKPHAYTHADNVPELRAGTVLYYRLRQVDLDGKVTLTAPAAVRLISASQVLAELWPNPAVGDATLRLPTDATVHVADALGRPVWQAAARAGSETITLPAAAWPRGNYLVLVQAPGGASQTLRLSR